MQGASIVMIFAGIVFILVSVYCLMLVKREASFGFIGMLVGALIQFFCFLGSGFAGFFDIKADIIQFTTLGGGAFGAIIFSLGLIAVMQVELLDEPMGDLFSTMIRGFRTAREEGKVIREKLRRKPGDPQAGVETDEHETVE